MTKGIPTCEHKDRKIHAKGLCRTCYFKKMMANNPEKHKRILEKKRVEYKNIKEKDPEHFKKKAREWQRKKRAKDPTWNAKRQRDYRKKYPDKYHYIMARYYLRKMALDKRVELAKELGILNG